MNRPSGPVFRATIIAVVCLWQGSGSAQAAPITIVALGASNTAGMKLSQAEAYPAQLERILRARGLDVQVVNAGVSGQTTETILARVRSDVPDGTRIVILQPGNNDGRAGRRQGNRVIDPADTIANLDSMVSQLEARGIAVAMFNGFHGVGREVAQRHRAVFLGNFVGGLPDTAFQPDHEHLTAEGYAAVAARIAPRITAMLGQRSR